MYRFMCDLLSVYVHVFACEQDMDDWVKSINKMVKGAKCGGNITCSKVCFLQIDSVCEIYIIVYGNPKGWF